MKITLYVLLFFCMDVLHAQSAQQNNSGGITMRGNYGNQISIADVNGRPFEKKYADVDGTAFFLEDYKYATLQLLNGTRYERIQAKVDLFSNQINIITTDKKEFYLPAGTVTSILFTDSAKNDSISYYFKCGFPPIGEITASNFYQVLVEGKCSLLKSIGKRLNIRKNDLSGEETKEFETYESYFVFSNKKMVRIKKDKSTILNELNDKRKQVDEFIQNNGINTKDIKDLIIVIKYYNTL